MSTKNTPNDRRKNRLDEAILEAERFIRKAKQAIAKLEGEWAYGSVEYAAAKRASMDLTRALTPLRKSV